ncbi:hypothetical protein DFH09DRAFT_1470732 [Mycena vulgaris]|nr:hypothetical protein DFH09DRAFT_1470732 [Mycena vulgaris]
MNLSFLPGRLYGMNRPVSKVPSTLPFPGVSTPSHNYLTSLQRNPPHTLKVLVELLAFYFFNAFDAKRAPSDIFTFAEPVLAWAKQPAEFVELHATADGEIHYFVISGSNAAGPLARCAHDLNEIVSWTEHKHRTPFCPSTAVNHDLLFVLKLADALFTWVVVQATPTASDGTDLLTSLEDKSMFSTKRALELLNTLSIGSDTTTNTRLTLLRVVASFKQIILKGRMTKAAVQASLSTEMFATFTAAMSPSEIIANIVAKLVPLGSEGEHEVETEAKTPKKEAPIGSRGKSKAKSKEDSDDR